MATAKTMAATMPMIAPVLVCDATTEVGDPSEDAELLSSFDCSVDR
ncbi:hypothetical protein PC118_g20544 [Phytophthora cactorum]|uniref:Uncharacterized protein n=1 Tax=Phytophthora cactorum TaxID=29920 RepID=A0A8T1F2G5_9STRA|nr:hypothetical protein PC118_g20544 [Phytophthora cactorum]